MTGRILDQKPDGNEIICSFTERGVTIILEAKINIFTFTWKDKLPKYILESPQYEQSIFLTSLRHQFKRSHIKVQTWFENGYILIRWSRPSKTKLYSRFEEFSKLCRGNVRTSKEFIKQHKKETQDGKNPRSLSANTNPDTD